jgi:4-amino-4-deoxychorismate lyase
MIFVNGVVTDHVAATDRGLAYGDGVFRTLRMQGDRPRWWARHYRKLETDCAVLGIPCPPEAILSEEVERATARSRDEVVKIIVTRGTGPRGYAPPRQPSPTRIILTGPAPDYPEAYHQQGVAVFMCRTRLASQPLLAGVKHLNRLENVLARAEWDDPAIAEGLMLDEDGNVVGGTMTNLFLLERGALVTPPLTRCGVAGVTRDVVKEAAAKHGMICREEPVSRARLIEADGAFLVNSLVGAWPIRSCAGRDWENGIGMTRVREWLDEAELA